jgi:prefoldin subunit 5
VAEGEVVTAIFATKQDIERLTNRIDQLDADMEAIAKAIKRNNETLQELMDAVQRERQILRAVS